MILDFNVSKNDLTECIDRISNEGLEFDARQDARFSMGLVQNHSVIYFDRC
jgi:hypothetical protein